MPGLGLEIKIVFEPAGTAKGESCCKCMSEIKGEKYQAVLQFGSIEQLILKELNLFMCEECKNKQG